MSKKRKRRVKKSSSPTSKITPWQIGVVVGVVILIAGVLWLKGRPTESEAATADLPTPVTPTDDGVTEASSLPETPPSTTEAPGESVQTDLAPREDESPEEHLDRLLEEGQPIFAFFHSDTCYQCVEMDKIVQQVYPDFAGQVALVDVNVYDEANRSLLQRAGIQVIPTLIFIDHTGQGEGTTGIMPAEQLQERLTELADGASS